MFSSIFKQLPQNSILGNKYWVTIFLLLISTLIFNITFDSSKPEIQIEEPGAVYYSPHQIYGDIDIISDQSNQFERTTYKKTTVNNPHIIQTPDTMPNSKINRVSIGLVSRENIVHPALGDVYLLLDIPPPYSLA